MPRISSEVPSSSTPTQSEPGPGDGAFSLESSHGREPSGHDSFPGGYGDMIGDGEDDDLLPGDADAHEVGFRATSEDFGALDELGVELSPWAPLLGLLDATEPEEFPDDRPFTPADGAEGPHALELRAESMLQFAARGAQRTGELDRTEVGLSDDNRDVVAGRDEVEVDGMLDEHTGHGLVVLADDVEMNVGGSLAMHAHLEDNVIMGGVMTDEFAGGTFITAAMSDDMVAGAGIRCTAPLDVWVHGLAGMEERPGTCAADGVLSELAGTLYEREYGPSAHVAAVARFQGTTATTMKTGFRPLMKVALGVRNLIPGGGGGGGSASASPPAAPPPPGGGEAAGSATLAAAEGGGALGRGVADGDDTDEIVSVVRSVESASDAAEVEDLQHPANAAENLDALARADAEGGGFQQVAEIYEQPVPLAPEQAGADAFPGAGPAAPESGGRQPPPLDRSAPGTEGYDFRNAYGSLHDRNQFYRQEMNLRGNLYLREYLAEIDATAIELVKNLDGPVDEITIDNYGLRAASAYATLETMADEAEMAGNLERLADIRAAMAEFEGLVDAKLGDVAAHTDDFSGVAIGSQRGPIDPNIDVDKLRSWLEDQKLVAQQAMTDPQTSFESMQQLSWTMDYYDQMLKALDDGINPLAESSDQVAFIQVAKVDAADAKYLAEHAEEFATLGDDWVVVPPWTQDHDQLELFLELHDGLMETLSDPEYFRSAEEMGGDIFAAGAGRPGNPGPDVPEPDSMPPLAGGVDEPDVTPMRAGDVPAPPPPDLPVADPSAGPGPAAPGSTRREPPPLDRTAPGTEGYDFRKAYGSLDQRNQFYRGELNYRGNLFMREYLAEIDTKALALFASLDGSADDIAVDGFGHRTSSIYRNLEEMAAEADTAGKVDRAANVRAAMAELDAMVDGTLAEVAVRTDEFSGAVPWSPRSPIDSHIDTVKLRSWLQEQADQAQARHLAAQTDDAEKLASWEWGYYVLQIQALDEGVNPLAVSNEQITVTKINAGKPNRAQSADDVAGAAPEAHDLAGPLPRPETEVEVYARLQDLLLATLSDPEFHRSAEEMGAGAFTFPVRARIDEGLDFLGPDSLRPFGAGDVPPSLSAVDFADSAGYVDEVRDRSFARSALAASEETLERQAAGLAEGDASVRSRAPGLGSGTPEPSLDTRRAPPDNARAPNIDEHSGRWVLEPYTGPDASTHAPGDDVSSLASDVSWESGLQVSDDSEAGVAAGDADNSDLFKAAPEPEDVNLDGTGDARRALTENDDGASRSPTTRSHGTRGEDANPTGAVSGPDDFTTTPPRGDGTGTDRSGSASRITPDTPAPVSTAIARSGSGTDVAPPAGTRSQLYRDPVSFEGRSLEGAPRAGDSKELAQSLDGAELPVEDLPRVEPDTAEPARKSILKHSDGASVSDSYTDLPDDAIQARLAQARDNRRWSNDGTSATDSVWTGTMWSGERRDVAALREANARWSEFAAAQRTSSVAFSDDPRQLTYLVEHEATVRTRSRGRYVDLYRGAEPPNTIDRAQATHYIPRPRGWEPARETGFGRLSQGWNEFPFSAREQIVNALSKGESLSPHQIADLESGLEGYRTAEGGLSSSQYRAMVDMISDLGDPHRRGRWHMQGWRGQRLLQLIEILDYAVVVA